MQLGAILLVFYFVPSDPSRALLTSSISVIVMNIILPALSPHISMYNQNEIIVSYIKEIQGEDAREAEERMRLFAFSYPYLLFWNVLHFIQRHALRFVINIISISVMKIL